MTRLLAPLGMTRVREAPKTVGYGKTYPEFWLNERPQLKPPPDDSGAHICLRAPDTQAVDAFHAAALSAGAKSDGAPGKRPQYSLALLRRLHPRLGRQSHRGGDVLARCGLILIVIAGLDPAIHLFPRAERWITGSSPVMTPSDHSRSAGTAIAFSASATSRAALRSFGKISSTRLATRNSTLSAEGTNFTARMCSTSVSSGSQ